MENIYKYARAGLLFAVVGLGAACSREAVVQNNGGVESAVLPSKAENVKSQENVFTEKVSIGSLEEVGPVKCAMQKDHLLRKFKGTFDPNTEKLCATPLGVFVAKK